MSVVDLADRAWASALGCDVATLRTPGNHLIPGGPRMAGAPILYAMRVEDAVLLFCPPELHDRASAIGDWFDSDALRSLGATVVHGPSIHSFVDRPSFVPIADGGGVRVERDDTRLGVLRAACGEDDWNEGGFGTDDAILYGIDVDGDLVAAGNLTAFGDVHADVGLVTHPAWRGRGLATRMASHVTFSALAATDLVRYRALATNTASLAIARKLGFVARGENLFAPLG